MMKRNANTNHPGAGWLPPCANGERFDRPGSNNEERTMQLMREIERNKRRYRITVSMKADMWWSDAQWKTEVERWSARRKTWDEVDEWHDIVSGDEIRQMRRELRDSISLG